MINRMPKPKSFLWPSVSLCSHWYTVLTARGSPLIRIMAKSIAGTARGPVHAPLYESEANSCVSERVRAFAWRNIKTGCRREDCGDETVEPDRDKGWKQMRETRGLDSRWLKSGFFFFFWFGPSSFQDPTKTRPDADLLRCDPRVIRPLNCPSLVTLLLCSSLSWTIQLTHKWVSLQGKWRLASADSLPLWEDGSRVRAGCFKTTVQVACSALNSHSLWTVTPSQRQLH